MGKRQRRRQREFGMRKQPNESKQSWFKRLQDYFYKLDREIPSPNFGDDK